MRPIDPRLLRQARGARGYLACTTLLGFAGTGLILAQALLLARILAAAFNKEAFGYTPLLLLAVVIGRAVVSYGTETSALRAASAVKSQLRRRLVGHALALGPGSTRTGEITTLITRGLDAVDAYFARYLPQLILAGLTPVAVLVVIGRADLVSVLVVVLTLPLIPIFMVLVGLHTRARTDRQWRLLERLGGHFLDVVEGLTTLKIFNRAAAQAVTIRKVTEAHRKATMGTLRVAFLSALVLELLATLAVALVAVEVGLRLLHAVLPYQTALVVLLLAPEAYLPLRNVGAQFHASMEGVTAAQRALDLLDLPTPKSRHSAATPPDPTEAEVSVGLIRLEGVTVRYPGREDAALDNVSLTLRPGERVTVVGRSGAGKSTLLGVLMGAVRPDSGRTSFEAADPVWWRRQVGWVPQSPYLFAGSVAENIRLGDPDAPPEAVRQAAELAGASGFIEALPQAYDTPIGERGARLSSGQRQRIALARAFLRDAPLLLLDEPTAHLDPATAAGIRDVTERLMAGRTVVTVAHDSGWADRADRVLTLEAGRLTESALTGAPA